ncbi:MAG: tetratricopeptide repeat protein [Desulfuromonadaceae bacterium]|nr:tetratricopeptide repeat protein [Desulfuromonadaceae bacterium]MDD2855386.1 tetratricopeptide repeat protein [Desulfuromonadaceae bacterium]
MEIALKSGEELQKADADLFGSFNSKSVGNISSIKSIVLICLALAVITFALYLPALNNGFISFDDGIYVADNQHVVGGITAKNIYWAFTSLDSNTGNYHPVTWLSHLADVELFGLNPRGHHLTSILVHIAAAVVLFFLILRLTGKIWQSSFVAAIFALHPLHVESVAWVAERKDVLSAFFWFSTLFAYSFYVTKRKPSLYLLTLSLFVLGLLSKPMLVTLPLIMLLMDFRPFRRFINDEEKPETLLDSKKTRLALITEKIPFFLFSILSSIITIYVQNNSGAMGALENLPLHIRIQNSVISYCTYIGKTFWPSDLAILYPFPQAIPLWHFIASLILLTLISAAAIHLRRSHPYLFFGWLWFIVTLIPVIGLVQVGSQSMADRYTYIPMTGLIVMAVGGFAHLTAHYRNRLALSAIITFAILIASIWFSRAYLSYWKDSTSLYRHTLEVTEGNYIIHYNMGIELQASGDFDAAMQEYSKSILINPQYIKPRTNRGIILNIKGYPDAAILEFEQVIRLNPHYSKAHINLGVVFADKGELDLAIREFREALRISPLDLDAHYNMGLAFAAKGDLDAAIRAYQEALRINPDSEKVHNNMGVAFAMKGDLESAIKEYQILLDINPENRNAKENIDMVLAQRKKRGL